MPRRTRSLPHTRGWLKTPTRPTRATSMRFALRLLLDNTRTWQNGDHREDGRAWMVTTHPRYTMVRKRGNRQFLWRGGTGALRCLALSVLSPHPSGKRASMRGSECDRLARCASLWRRPLTPPSPRKRGEGVRRLTGTGHGAQLRVGMTPHCQCHSTILKPPSSLCQ